MTSTLLAIWCDSADALLPIAKDGNRPSHVELCVRRLAGVAPIFILVPWTRELDHVAETIKAKQLGAVVRCSRVRYAAMRDLVAERGVDFAALANCDARQSHAEVIVSLARALRGLPDAGSTTVRSHSASEWLASGEDQWIKIGRPTEHLFADGENSYKQDARMIRDRKG